MVRTCGGEREKMDEVLRCSRASKVRHIERRHGGHMGIHLDTAPISEFQGRETLW